MSGDEMESWYWNELLDLATNDVHEEVMRRVELLEAENAELKRQYYELIMEVVNKIEGETRHETALRCIREHELRDSGPAQSV